VHDCANYHTPEHGLHLGTVSERLVQGVYISIFYSPDMIAHKKQEKEHTKTR